MNILTHIFVFKHIYDANLICDARIIDIFRHQITFKNNFKNKGKENIIIRFDEENEQYCIK